MEMLGEPMPVQHCGSTVEMCKICEQRTIHDIYSGTVKLKRCRKCKERRELEDLLRE